MRHEPLTWLEQEQLDWISRFADRLRMEEAPFADLEAGHEANELGRTLWENPDWRRLAPEEAALCWLAQQAGH